MLVLPQMSDLVWLMSRTTLYPTTRTSTPTAVHPTTTETAFPTTTTTTTTIPGSSSSTPWLTSIPTTLPTIIPDLPDFQKITSNVGGTTLWIGFIGMLLGAVVLVGVAWKSGVSKRTLSANAALASLISSVAYLAMAIHQGSFMTETTIHEGHHVDRTIHRQVFWARQVDWILTIPLVIANLGFASGMPGAQIGLAIVAGLFMNLSSLFATLSGGGTGGQKWTWYSVAVLSFIVLIYQIGVHGRAAAAAKSTRAAQAFDGLVLMILIIVTANPVIWAISTGTRHISVNAEVIAYTVIDLLLKLVGNGAIVWAASRVAELGVEISGFWTEGLAIGPHGRIRLGESDGVGSGQV